MIIDVGVLGVGNVIQLTVIKRLWFSILRVHGDEVLKDSSKNYYSQNILLTFKAASAAL
jgi:hypothetical protein